MTRLETRRGEQKKALEVIKMRKTGFVEARKRGRDLYYWWESARLTCCGQGILSSSNVQYNIFGSV